MTQVLFVLTLFTMWVVLIWKISYGDALSFGSFLILAHCYHTFATVISRGFRRRWNERKGKGE